MRATIAFALCFSLAAFGASDGGTDDLKRPSQGPHSVHIGICTGSDIRGNDVLLLDRMCLNRQAVVTTVATIGELQRDRKMLVEMLNQSEAEKAKTESDSDQKAILAGLSGLGAGLTILGVVLGGLKAAGKL